MFESIDKEKAELREKERDKQAIKRQLDKARFDAARDADRAQREKNKVPAAARATCKPELEPSLTPT